MKPFLKSVSEYVMSTFGDRLDKVCMVFPNKRASLYFNKYLAENLSGPVWAPQYTTISELMNQISGLVTGEPLILQYELYKAYCKVHANPEPFEQFYSWGLTILSDFDDIDKYRVDASKLFLNLSDLKEIDERFDYLSDEQKEIIRSYWGNAKFSQATPLKTNFLNFWLELGQIYPLYKEQLIKRSIAYEGLVYLEVSNKIKKGDDIPLPFEQYCFVGFNALNECEKILFDFFRKSRKANFFWDYDNYYIQNEWHEAGLFLRDNIKRYPSPDFDLDENVFLNSPKTINIIATNNDVAQAKILPQIIKKENNTIQLNTAVVLSDESLLVPVLSSLPEEVEKVNITMGYPFANSPAFTLFDLIIRLLRNERKNSESGRLFFHRDVLALLRHPYLQLLWSEETGKLVENIVSENRIYIRIEEFETIPAIQDFLNSVDNNRLDKLSLFLLDLATGMEENPENEPLDIQYLLSLYSQTNKLNNLIKAEGIEMPGVALLRFLRQLAQSIKVSFIGEPLTDFQVLGVLETRILDFDRVIMMSVNEGILPAKDKGNSYIPYTLRKALGMPTIEYHDAIYAYYFYRFIQRAKVVTLVYNAQSGGMQTGEMSRYLYQLKYSEHFKVKEQSLTFQISIPSEKPIVIEKDEKVMALLTNFATKKIFTPTSLNSWLSCSLKFYFRFLQNLKEKEEISDDVDAADFGKLVHKALQLLYNPFIEKTITREDITAIDQDQLEWAISESFEILYPSRGNHSWKLSGKNLIIKEIILKYIRKILEVDSNYAPFEIKTLESLIEREVQFPGISIPIRIGGYVDRIDFKAGIYRIIDYKTGEATPTFASIENLFQGEKRKSKDAAFQCLVYAFVLTNSYPEGAIQAGLYSVKKMFDKSYNPQLRYSKGELLYNIRDKASELENNLETLLQQMFDPSVPFTKTNDLKACENCAYKGICHR